MQAFRFTEKLARAERCQYGTWVKLPCHETLDMLALAGLDFIVLDTEHAPLTLETCARLTAHAQALGLSVLVRAPDQRTNDYQRLLDLGIDGLLIPRVRDEREAQAAVSRMRFSPIGERGLGITSRAGHWGMKPLPQYLSEGNDHTLRCLQLEDPQVLDNAREVLSVEGVNAAFLGMGDLTMTTGLSPTDPSLQKRVDHLLAVCQSLNLPCGAAAQDAESARRAAQRGFAFVMISNDASIFGKATQAIWSSLHPAL